MNKDGASFMGVLTVLVLILFIAGFTYCGYLLGRDSMRNTAWQAAATNSSSVTIGEVKWNCLNFSGDMKYMNGSVFRIATRPGTSTKYLSSDVTLPASTTPESEGYQKCTLLGDVK